jgi:hypothetical protein
MPILKETLTEIVKTLEETIIYLAAVENALIENGGLERGEARMYVPLQTQKTTTKVRRMISHLPASV